MERMGTAYLVPEGFARDEADQVQNLRQRDRGSDLSEVNAWHGGDPQVRAFRTNESPKAALGPGVENREEEPVISSGEITYVIYTDTTIST